MNGHYNISFQQLKTTFFKLIAISQNYIGTAIVSNSFC